MAKPYKVWLVDDDPDLREMLSTYLQGHGYDVRCFESAEQFSSRLEIQRPDLLVLDLMLPGEDGLSLLRRLRDARDDLAIVMLTAKGDPMDRVIGLEIGADDYLPKPFEPRELLARIRAILRRGSADAAKPGAQKNLRFGSLEIDRNARTVTVGGRLCELTSYQFDLLVAMAERAGRVLTRDQIMEAVRGRELEAFDRSIDVHMGRIRAAIEADVKTPRRILTVRGVGYKLTGFTMVRSVVSNA
jgi:DNA-binding response OmpR family regulator